MARIKILITGNTKKRTNINTLEEAADFGAKLAKIGAVLQDPTKIEIVNKRYFRRNDPNFSVFIAHNVGDNGKQYGVAIVYEKAASDDDFVKSAKGGDIPSPT